MLFVKMPAVVASLAVGPGVSSAPPRAELDIALLFVFMYQPAHTYVSVARVRGAIRHESTREERAEPLSRSRKACTVRGGVRRGKKRACHMAPTSSSLSREVEKILKLHLRSV